MRCCRLHIKVYITTLSSEILSNVVLSDKVQDDEIDHIDNETKCKCIAKSVLFSVKLFRSKGISSAEPDMGNFPRSQQTAASGSKASTSEMKPNANMNVDQQLQKQNANEFRNTSRPKVSNDNYWYQNYRLQDYTSEYPSCFNRNEFDKLYRFLFEKESSSFTFDSNDHDSRVKHIEKILFS
uniref:Uncharacterized protein n=1 Tax=Syphacia muris TaxID=451379 RepID=A0A0N5AM13_9BILA